MSDELLFVVSKSEAQYVDVYSEMSNSALCVFYGAPFTKGTTRACCLMQYRVSAQVCKQIDLSRRSHIHYIPEPTGRASRVIDILSMVYMIHIDTMLSM